MPDLGIIGFERSGKTSLFNAVTGADHAVGFATHTDPHIGMVKVPDVRLDRLSAQLKSRKTTPADLQYIDFPGGGFGGGKGPAPRFLQQLSNVDALVHVVRAFDDDSVPHPHGSVDAARDIESMALELTFADLALIETRLQRIATESKALKPGERAQAEREVELLQRLRPPLESNVPLRAVSLDAEERKSLRHYRFLTNHALLTVVNVNEADAGRAEAIAADFRPDDEPPGSATAAVCAALERELGALSPDEADAYRREVGATEGALAQAVRLSYAVLGLISFFTLSEDESRAWSIVQGSSALDAAGKVHSDIQRGFIRAEIISWQDMIDVGSEAEARKRALLRTEGRDYRVQDGDVLHILFNV